VEQVVVDIDKNIVVVGLFVVAADALVGSIVATAVGNIAVVTAVDNIVVVVVLFLVPAQYSY
jgi:hypothetical protein